jgi:ABC-type glycerol-3-phosphate transport system substrate-binding protein
MASRVTRRTALKVLGGMAAGAVLAKKFAGVPAVIGKDLELVHWSWLTASDAEVWGQVIDNFNTAHKDKGVQIRIETIPDDQYGTKVLSSAATGNAPDFGWGTAGLRADWVKKGVVVPADDIMKKAGLDFGDFTAKELAAARYGGKLGMVPMDAMSLQIELNIDHAQAAGLDINHPPQTGDDLLMWAERMTQRQGDTVTRSGFLMTGSGVQTTVTWGIIAYQMGFRRASADLKHAAVDPEAGERAARWVLDLYDKHKVSTRDITDRYKAFGTAQGSMFLTGPWTLNGYVKAGLNFMTFPMVKVGRDRSTYLEIGGMEMYEQRDESRYDATAQAIKWLSDNSFLWTTKGRGASVRKSILARPDYKTAGNPWKVRGAFIQDMPNAVVGEVPVSAGPDFTIYTGDGFAAKTMDPVWAKQTSPHDAIQTLTQQWQADLDAG